MWLDICPIIVNELNLWARIAMQETLHKRPTIPLSNLCWMGTQSIVDGLGEVKCGGGRRDPLPPIFRSWHRLYLRRGGVQHVVFSLYSLLVTAYA